MSNDNTESISAKLRRWADESESDNRRHFYPTFNACDDLGIKVPDDDFVSERELFRRIADEIDREKREIAERYACQSWMNPADAIAKLATGEIEWAELQQAIDRYYLPRPLFEDGEPVQFGEMAAHPILDKPSPIKSIEYFGDGSFALWFDGTEAITGYDNGERVRRPEPRVLDADGVPIEVGDTVWKVGCKHAYGVCEIDESKFYDVLVVRKDCGLMNRFYHDKLTHREPDSLKKLLNDIRGYLAESPCIDVHVRPWERRLTALIELDGRDA